MGKNRRQYTKEFRIEAVRLIVEEGRPISEVARELGTAQSLLHRWKKKSEKGESARKKNTMLNRPSRWSPIFSRMLSR